MKDTIGIFHRLQKSVQTVVLVRDDRIDLRCSRSVSIDEDENRHHFPLTDGVVNRLPRSRGVREERPVRRVFAYPPMSERDLS